MATSQDEQKRKAAEAAARRVTPGMHVGLGTGSTIAHAVRWLGERLVAGELPFTAVCTSTSTEQLAARYGIPCLPLDGDTRLDIYIDGADQIDPQGVMVKGGGGALLREKLVAMAATDHVIVVDATKPVERLGITFPLPVEIVSFGMGQTMARLAAVPGCEPRVRLTADGEPYRTDEGHHIADCVFPQGIENPRATEARLKAITGVVETGLFLDLCRVLLIGTPDGVQEKTFTKH